ncbi:precursor of CEP9-like [Rhodamnia argentea]|uniref:Precursor of CEP9-like n=1 Tax=Rhodamnia argentea TaxID=178133 RepID=A0ABM3HVG3_9MYRT|nr:precursor of CEP9-like [Rhodamnia argentea]
MADLRVVSIFAIIFTFVVFDANLTSEGRPIKSAWQDELRALNNDQMYERASQYLTPCQSPASDDHSDGRKEMVPSPTTHDQAVDSGDLEAEDDFRPTDPGNSPGAGHSFIGSKKGGAQPKAPSGDKERPTVMGTLGDFRPTGPGHSPGVGHVFENKNGEPKA